MRDRIKLRGDLHFRFKNVVTGLVRNVYEKNLVVDTGLEFYAAFLAGEAITQMSHMSVGEGTTPVAPGDTALVSEIDRNALSSITRTGKVISYVCNWPAGDGTGSLTESGLHNAAAGGTMLSRSVYGVKTKGTNDDLTLTWKMTLA